MLYFFVPSQRWAEEIVRRKGKRKYHPDCYSILEKFLMVGLIDFITLQQENNRMNCLIIAATPVEIVPFVDYYKSNKKKDIDLLITGIGLTATTYSLMKQLSIKKPDCIIQAGVGGSFNKKLKPGDVVIVKKEAIADQSVIELNKLKTLFDLKLVPQNQFPFKNGWLINSSDLLKKSTLKKVKGISVNEITTSKQKVSFYEQTFAPQIESMEGAALHYVCLMEKIPFLQLRAVSNFIAERNKKNWNMKDSIINLNNELIGLVEKI